MKSWLLLTLLSCSVSAQYRNDMPAVATEAVSDAAQLSEQCVSEHYQTQVSPAMGGQYRQMGSPKILVLLGRRLGSDLSEWQGDTRDTISTMNRAYQGGHQSKDTRDTIRMTEKRKVISVSVSPGMQAFYKGFSEYMQAANIGMVSYDSIVRAAQRHNEIAGTIDRSVDFREVEADAILGHVDILIEILDAGAITVLGKKVDKIQINVTRMDTFETLSQHTGLGPEYYEIDEKWVAGSDGYEALKTVTLHHSDVGYQLAEELLQKALARPFLNKTPTLQAGPQPTGPQVRKKKRVLPPKAKN